MKNYTLTGSQGDTPSAIIDPSYNQIAVGVSYFTDDSLSTPFEPVSGTISVQGRVHGNRGWSELSESPINCADSASYATNSIPIEEIRLISTGLPVGIVYQAIVTARKF